MGSLSLPGGRAGSGRISNEGDMAVWVAAGDNGPGTHNGVRPQVNPGQDDGVHAQPAMVANADGWPRKVKAEI